MTRKVDKTTIRTTNNIDIDVETTIFDGATSEEGIIMALAIKNGHIDFDFTSMLGDEETFIHATTSSKGNVNEMAKAFTELMNIFNEK